MGKSALRRKGGEGSYIIVVRVMKLFHLDEDEHVDGVTAQPRHFLLSLSYLLSVLLFNIKFSTCYQVKLSIPTHLNSFIPI